MSVTAMAAPAPTGPGPLFCVLVPHFKDDYWLSVGFGLEREAERRGVALLFFEAGGYEARTTQIGQLDACVARGADAILIGAVTSDHPDLIAALDRVALKTPIFGLVNELHAESLSGRVGVDWHDMGLAIGAHLNRLHPAGSPPMTAVFLTGPAEAGWTGPLEAGLRQGLTGSSVKIVEEFEADTGIRPQLALAETALERHPDADYMIGSAPAIEAAMGLLAAHPDAHRPELLATYVSHTVIRGLMNGTVAAASFDDPILQAQMAIRQAASDHPDPAERLAPEIVLLSREDEDLEAVRISPADYFPAVQ